MTLNIPYIGEITAQQVTALVLSGMTMGAILTSGLMQSAFQAASDESLLIEPRIINEPSVRTYSKRITSCSALCYQPPEKIVIQKKPVARTGVRAPGTTRVADLPTNPKNPNAIRITLAEAPTILSKVNKVNGKGTCIKKNDKGHKSKKFSKPHIDRQCCLDPDEIPNPRCLYK